MPQMQLDRIAHGEADVCLKCSGPESSRPVLLFILWVGAGKARTIGVPGLRLARRNKTTCEDEHRY